MGILTAGADGQPRQLREAPNFTFIPLAFETHGGMSVKTGRWLDWLVEAYSGRRNAPRYLARTRIFQRIARTLQQGNANLLLSKVLAPVDDEEELTAEGLEFL